MDTSISPPYTSEGYAHSNFAANSSQINFTPHASSSRLSFSYPYKGLINIKLFHPGNYSLLELRCAASFENIFSLACKGPLVHGIFNFNGQNMELGRDKELAPLTLNLSPIISEHQIEITCTCLGAQSEILITTSKATLSLLFEGDFFKVDLSPCQESFFSNEKAHTPKRDFLSVPSAPDCLPLPTAASTIGKETAQRCTSLMDITRNDGIPSPISPLKKLSTLGITQGVMGSLSSPKGICLGSVHSLGRSP